MDIASIAETLADFKQHAGSKFKNEPLAPLLAKYLVFNLYPGEWPDIINAVYGENNRSTQDQVSALHNINTDEMRRFNEAQCWRMLEMLRLPSRIQVGSNKLVINNRVTRETVPLYLAHMKRVGEDVVMNTLLNALPDSGFLLCTADHNISKRVLIDSAVTARTNTKPVHVQRDIWPELNRMHETRREEKLAELAALLRFAFVKPDEETVAVFTEHGLIPQKVDLQQERAKKAQLVEQLVKHDQERTKLLENIDEEKLKEHGYTLDSVTRNIGNLSRMRRDNVLESLDYIRNCLAIIAECQLDDMGKRRNTIARIEQCHRRRGEILQSREFDSRTYYRENPLGKEMAHTSQRTVDMDLYDLHNYEHQLEMYNNILSKYLTLTLQPVKQPISTGFFF